MELLCNFVVNGMNKLNYKFVAWFFYILIFKSWSSNDLCWHSTLCILSKCGFLEHAIHFQV